MTRGNKFRSRSTRADGKRNAEAVEWRAEYGQNSKDLRSAVPSYLVLNLTVTVRTCASMSTVESAKIY